MTMMCQCLAGICPCDRPLTQEDLLCDECRVGITCMVARGVDVNALLDERTP